MFIEFLSLILVLIFSYTSLCTYEITVKFINNTDLRAIHFSFGYFMVGIRVSTSLRNGLFFDIWLSQFDAVHFEGHQKGQTLAMGVHRKFSRGGKIFYFLFKRLQKFSRGGQTFFNNCLFHKTGKKMSKFPQKVLKKL
jgi:hypothetical protein